MIQRNVRGWVVSREWQWWLLFTKLKPLLSSTIAEEEMARKQVELKETEEKLARFEGMKESLTAKNLELKKVC